jgi:hypothetical protein
MAVLLGLAALLLLTGSVLAMSSTNYALDWYVQLTGNGGPAGSAGYAINLTVGQTAIGGPTTSTSYSACLGYWCGTDRNRIYLPAVMKNS